MFTRILVASAQSQSYSTWNSIPPNSIASEADRRSTRTVHSRQQRSAAADAAAGGHCSTATRLPASRSLLFSPPPAGACSRALSAPKIASSFLFSERLLLARSFVRAGLLVLYFARTPVQLDFSSHICAPREYCTVLSYIIQYYHIFPIAFTSASTSASFSGSAICIGSHAACTRTRAARLHSQRAICLRMLWMWLWLWDDGGKSGRDPTCSDCSPLLSSLLSSPLAVNVSTTARARTRVLNARRSSLGGHRRRQRQRQRT